MKPVAIGSKRRGRSRDCIPEALLQGNQGLKAHVFSLLLRGDSAGSFPGRSSMTAVSLCPPPRNQTMSGRSGTASVPTVGMSSNTLVSLDPAPVQENNEDFNAKKTGPL